MEYREYQHILPGAGRHLNKKPSWWQRTRIDFMLLLLIFLIMSSGLVVLYSGSGASFTAVEKQLLRYGLAMGLMIFLAQIDLRKFSRWVPIFYLLGLLLLVAVLVLGYGAKGAQRLAHDSWNNSLPAIGVNEIGVAIDVSLVLV